MVIHFLRHTHHQAIINDLKVLKIFHISSHSAVAQRFFIIVIEKRSGSKAPDFDAYELLRATHSHNSTLYSHIVGLSSHFYAHIGAGPKVFHPPMSKLMWA